MANFGNGNPNHSYEPVGHEPNDVICVHERNGQPYFSVCCPVCLREVWITSGGRFRTHNCDYQKRCPQSGEYYNVEEKVTEKEVTAISTPTLSPIEDEATPTTIEGWLDRADAKWRNVCSVRKKLVVEYWYIGEAIAEAHTMWMAARRTGWVREVEKRYGCYDTVYQLMRMANKITRAEAEACKDITDAKIKAGIVKVSKNENTMVYEEALAPPDVYVEPADEVDDEEKPKPASPRTKPTASPAGRKPAAAPGNQQTVPTPPGNKKKVVVPLPPAERAERQIALTVEVVPDPATGCPLDELDKMSGELKIKAEAWRNGKKVADLLFTSLDSWVKPPQA